MLEFMQDGQDKASEPVVSAGGFNGGIPDGKAREGDDFLRPAEHGKNLKQSTIVLAILFSLGVLSLWFMIKKTAPAPVSAAGDSEEAQIEMAIAQLTGVQTEMNTQMDSVIGRFYHLSDVDRLQVIELKKNPFSHDLSLTDFVDDSENMGLSLELLAREEVHRKAGDLELWSIMASDKGGCCMINDKLLYEGDSVEGFVVTRVSERFVELESKGVTVKLKMAE